MKSPTPEDDQELGFSLAQTRVTASVRNVTNTRYREPLSFIPEAGRSYVVFGKNGTDGVDLSAVAAGTGGLPLIPSTPCSASAIHCWSRTWWSPASACWSDWAWLAGGLGAIRSTYTG